MKIKIKERQISFIEKEVDLPIYTLYDNCGDGGYRYIAMKKIDHDEMIEITQGNDDWCISVIKIGDTPILLDPADNNISTKEVWDSFVLQFKAYIASSNL